MRRKVKFEASDFPLPVGKGKRYQFEFRSRSEHVIMIDRESMAEVSASLERRF